MGVVIEMEAAFVSRSRSPSSSFIVVAAVVFVVVLLVVFVVVPVVDLHAPRSFPAQRLRSIPSLLNFFSLFACVYFHFRPNHHTRFAGFQPTRSLLIGIYNSLTSFSSQ